MNYIKSELNVNDIKFSNDETACGIRYKVTADWPTLGRKLRKDLARVKLGLASVPSDDAKAYLDTGKLIVGGVELVSGDLLVTRYVDPPTAGQFATNSDNDTVALLDIQIYPDLHEQWMARELINRVQKLRKKADLQATDEVKIYYTTLPGNGPALDDMISSQGDVLFRSLRSVPLQTQDHEELPGQTLITEEQEIADSRFKLKIVRF